MKLKSIIIFSLFNLPFLSSCDDFLKTESTHGLFDYELTQKSDSMFMAYGIMQSLQELADQYVVTGEMRGDLADTTYYSDKSLREMATLSVTSQNKYNSPYTYYAVINNCNYYLAHRDTTLHTGASMVVMDEYAAVKAFRAWAYLMLVRNYGKVPFFTAPLTQISDINSNSMTQTLTLQEIVNRLTSDLEQYSGRTVPDYGPISCGQTNFGQNKTAESRLCFIPIDIILGELYLEAGRYEEAAAHYQSYISRHNLQLGVYAATPTFNWMDDDPPSDFRAVSGTSWANIWSNNSTEDIVTYIPMSVNYLNGTTTQLPNFFGYNYYSTSSKEDERFTGQSQIAPSAIYSQLADSADYYYATDVLATAVKSVRTGDMRRGGTFIIRPEGEYMRKYNNANVVLYRNTTIFLHLAEALNRCGRYADAFAILKTGVHKHGCGYTYGIVSPYQQDTIIGQKLKQIKYQFSTNNTQYTKEDSINAVEDLLCDEYAMEFAFEGTRYLDLIRLARHKNRAATYGSDFGTRWLIKKIGYKNTDPKYLADERHWYLPFK